MTLSPLFYASRRWAMRFVEMAQEIGDLPPPQLASGKEGRRGPGSSGADATDRDSERAIRKSRRAQRQFTGASFREIIAARHGAISPF